MIVASVGTESAALPDWPYFCRLVDDLSLTRHWTVLGRSWWRSVPRPADLYCRDVLEAVGHAIEAAEMCVQQGNDPSEQVRDRINGLLEKAHAVAPGLTDSKGTAKSANSSQASERVGFHGRHF